MSIKVTIGAKSITTKTFPKLTQHTSGEIWLLRPNNNNNANSYMRGTCIKGRDIGTYLSGLDPIGHWKDYDEPVTLQNE